MNRIRVLIVDVDPSKPDEKALVEAFKACTEIADGEFPETMDLIGITRWVIKSAESRGKQISDEDTQELLKQSVTIGRGFGFGFKFPESADAHYSTQGVKRDDQDRPIFWYKPEGQKTYRVIYADLTVKDADTAPKVEGAKRIAMASNTSKRAEK